mgnify:CR=1 FL=1
MLADPGAKPGKIGLIGRSRRSGCCAFQQEAAQFLDVLILADQLTDIFAAGAVASGANLLVDERLQRVRQRDVHRAHTSANTTFGKNWQDRRSG